ncbi:MAG: recombinase family protein [Clostridiales bacterium]|nr:recombinase family protein [Clostridiales bacterium]
MTKIELREKVSAKVYRTALYLRLSREDGDKYESDSIANQRKLLRDYINDRGEFCLVREYIDDGYSGSNFERPGWKKLMKALESGEVNCIIVKDLSRFGRNYIEVGRYLRSIFPVMNVRLVAVNDNFDTLNEWQNGDALTIPMKNLINDVYCRDISEKVSSQLRVMRKHGECVAAFVPYGYKKDPENRSKLIIDEEAAATVKQIFIWKLEGYGNQAIAQKLNDRRALSPYEYRVEKGGTTVCCFKRHPKALWASGSVYNILHNECYMGTLVQGKWKKLSFRSKDKVLLPKNEWIKVGGTHEAIIDPKLFSMVQEVMNKEIRACGGKRARVLSGFLFCGECGRQMILQSSYYKGKKYNYYTCKDCRDSGKKTKRISEAKACDAVLKAVVKTAEIALHMEKIVKKTEFKPENITELRRLEKQETDLKEEKERCQRLKNGLFRDFSSGLLTREEYSDYSEIYKTKIENAEAALIKIKEQHQKITSCGKDPKWIKVFKKYVNLTGLSRPVLAELVDKVYVYEGGKTEIVFKEKIAIEAAVEAYGCEYMKEGDDNETAVGKAV